MRVVIQRGSAEAGKRVSLTEHEIHHLRVRRARNGDKVEILDGAGLQGTGSLVQVGHEWMVEIESIQHTQRPPETTLAVAAGDRERFSWMVEKSVELGVTRIVPLETAHTVGVATRLKESHVERLRRSALEVIKQCGASWVPEVENPMQLESFLQTKVRGGAWLADSEGAAAPVGMDRTPVSVVIGPEGGFTDHERTSVLAAGFQPVVLGPHTLRFETAALAAAVVVAQSRLRGQHG